MAKRAPVADLMALTTPPTTTAAVPEKPVTPKKNPREGWQVAQFRFRPTTWKGLRQIALDRDENVQILIEKALMFYLAAKGIKTNRLELRSDDD